MHVRGQIREVLRALLTTVPALGNRIFFDTDEVPEEEEYPFAVVSIGDEDIETESLGGLLKRDVAVDVDIFYQARTEALLAAEEIAAAVETKMATSSPLLAIVRSSFPQSIAITRSAEGARTVVQMRLQWLVTYSTAESDPTVAIP